MLGTDQTTPSVLVASEARWRHSGEALLALLMSASCCGLYVWRRRTVAAAPAFVAVALCSMAY